MPNNSKKTFKNEAKAADWFASPEGQRHAERILRKSIRNGTVKITKSAVRPTDPAILQKLLDNARASMTQAVSLRIPTSDIEAAKVIGEKKGVGYQTVLKEAIRRGLRHA